MIKKPVEDRGVYIHIILFFVFSVLFLASSVIFAYWYVFGNKSAFATYSKDTTVKQDKAYNNPKQQLKEVMWEKFLNFNSN